MSAWVRALREKSSGLDGPELTEDDGWPGSTRDPPTGFQPEFPPRPRGGDPESCPGVSTRVSRVLTSCCASRHKFSLGCGVGTQHLVPGSRKEGTRRPGSRPISPLEVGGGGDPASYPGVPTRVPHLDRGMGTWRFVLLLRGVQGVRTQPVVPWASEGGQDGSQRAVRLKGRRGRGCSSQISPD